MGFVCLCRLDGAGRGGGFIICRSVVGILYGPAPGDRRVGAQDEMGIFYLTAINLEPIRKTQESEVCGSEKHRHTPQPPLFLG